MNFDDYFRDFIRKQPDTPMNNHNREVLGIGETSMVYEREECENCDEAVVAGGICFCLKEECIYETKIDKVQIPSINRSGEKEVHTEPESI